jgi:Ca2+-binding RTX toxin-like protein
MSSIFSLAPPSLSQLSAPATNETIFVTSSYLVHAGETLDIGDSLGFRLQVEYGTSASLDIRGDVNVTTPHDRVAGVASTQAPNGIAEVQIRATSHLTVQGSGATIAAGVILETGVALVTNSGLVHVIGASGLAYGVACQSSNMTITNSGAIDVEALGFASGIVAQGDGTADNDGTITVEAGSAFGLAGFESVDVTNTGDIRVTGLGPSGFAAGAAISTFSSAFGPAHAAPASGSFFTNSGDIFVTGLGQIVGVEIEEVQSFINTGRVVADHDGAATLSAGLAFNSAVGGLVQNDGLIAGQYSILAADQISGGDGVSTDDVVINTGRLIGDVLMGAGSDGISNTGRIVGDVDLGDDGDIYIGNRGRLEGALMGGLGDDNLTGSHVGDVIYGDEQDTGLGGGADVLRGMGGDDTLYGGDGVDTLTGAEGADSLSGGDGNDVFKFTKLTDSVTGAADLITDLNNVDVISLRPIDADTGAGGDQAFTLVGAFTSHAGELVVSYDAGTDLTTISGDVDGDGDADLVITASGDHHEFTSFVL